MHSSVSQMTGFIALLIVQIVFLVLYWLFVRYDEEALPHDEDAGLTVQHVSKYPQFQDVQVMIFVGFAFLMAFLRKYGYSSTGYTLFLAALIVQWAVLVKGCLHMHNNTIRLSLESIIDADIAAAVPLISMGALLGRVTPIQLMFMALIEIVLFTANEHLALNIFCVSDIGGSITIHAFGAYFGLAVSQMLRPTKAENDMGQSEGASKLTDTFAMVGTLFLWVYWPSFNSILANGTGAERAIINTYLSLCAATVTAFIVSAFVSHENKLDMVHVQNSTLAGGVAVGSVCNLLIGSHAALLIGIIAGVVSVLGYRYLTPWMRDNMRLHDTCGIHNLHGMPALISAIASIIFAWLATVDRYKSDLTVIFPAMGNDNNVTTSNILGGYNRTANAQAGYQLFAIAATVLIAIVGGILTGLLLKYGNFRKLQKDEHHVDDLYWEVPNLKDEYLNEVVRWLEADNTNWRSLRLRVWNALMPYDCLYARGTFR